MGPVEQVAGGGRPRACRGGGASMAVNMVRRRKTVEAEGGGEARRVDGGDGAGQLQCCCRRVRHSWW